MNKTAFSHEKLTSGGKDEWLTPPEIIKALGVFDLDPCTPIDRPWDTAKCHYNIIDDGLKKSWSGRVWLNPPYGDQTKIWLSRLAYHGNGIALIFARTETKMFFDYVWGMADGVLFLKGRIRFYNIDGTTGNSPPAPSCLVAYGSENTDRLKNSQINGFYVPISKSDDKPQRKLF